MRYTSPLLGMMMALLCPSVASAAAEASTPAARQAIDASTSAALQGDARRTLEAVGSVPAEQFVGVDADYRACLFGRFERSGPPYLAPSIEDAFARELLTTYQDYWWHALSAPASRDSLDAALLLRLRSLIGAPADEDWDVVEKRLTDRLRERGYYALAGRTPPLRELMVWHKQTSKSYRVALPDSEYQVDVELLDDFVSRGWSYYARCGRGSAGGWAADDRIYAVVPWLDGNLDSDRFRASLLGHETQHFSDLKRFPKLEAWELEYRAKFTETWMARSTLPELLARFAASQSDDKDSPHTYANKRVLAALRAQLETRGIAATKPDLSDAPADAVRAAAHDVLLADSKRRMDIAKP
ncbi:hypothetical protein [Dokdonella sp.]|uniref:hypothetical protein n=1 Tax=Dokdonella sp. TaxID=2291710 RepID=UPI001B20BDE8|nr:hypothetical protein [Dokdonella sp.]MBO9662692.1 hypothetical protein [Dokdonella sp.]